MGRSAPPQFTGVHILVVDDDQLVRSYVVTQLRERGYRVTEAESGPEALEVLRKDATVALLFTDLVMPGGMNGRQLAEQARVLRPSMRVLFTSGYSAQSVAGLDGDSELLNKPYRRKALFGKIAAALGRCDRV